MTDDVLAKLLDKVEHRYYGKYRATVVDNDDPEHLGRLRLTIPGVLGLEIVSGWAMPCTPYGGAAKQGFFFIPERDSGVWVEFEAGLLEYPVWVGTFWCKPGGSTEVPEPAATQSPPTSKMIKTLAHTIELADEEDKETITIFDSNKNKVTMDKDGIKLVADKNIVTMDKDGIKLEAGKTVFNAAKDGNIELDAGTNDIKMTAANVKVTVSGSMDVG